KGPARMTAPAPAAAGGAAPVPAAAVPAAAVPAAAVPAAAVPAAAGRAAASLTAFIAIVRRDVLVTSREAVTFAVQTLVQPLFFLFVFGRLLAGIGVANRGFSVLLLPGVVAFSAFITPLQTVATDLGRDLGFTREIDDRLLAPLPTSLVAAEKVLIAAARGALSAAFVFPLAALVLGAGYHVRGDRIAPLAGLL